MLIHLRTSCSTCFRGFDKQVILQIDVSIDLLDEIQRNSIAIQINTNITNLWIHHFVIFIVVGDGGFSFLMKRGSAVSVRPVGKRIHRIVTTLLLTWCVKSCWCGMRSTL